MMIKKNFAMVFSCLALSITSSALANLTIINNSNIKKIKVQCSGSEGSESQAGIPISKYLSLPWIAIKPILGSFSGTCSFYDYESNKLEATASLNISNTYLSATITDFILANPNLHVIFTPGVHMQASEIKVTISGEQ